MKKAILRRLTASLGEKATAAGFRLEENAWLREQNGFVHLVALQQGRDGSSVGLDFGVCDTALHKVLFPDSPQNHLGCAVVRKVPAGESGIMSPYPQTLIGLDEALIYDFENVGLPFFEKLKASADFLPHFALSLNRVFPGSIYEAVYLFMEGDRERSLRAFRRFQRRCEDDWCRDLLARVLRLLDIQSL